MTLDETLEGTTTTSKSGPGSNGNEGGLHNPQIFRIGIDQMQFSVIPRILVFGLGGVFYPLYTKRI